MSSPFSFGGVNLDASPGSSPARAATVPDTPFRIALLGDFSGRESRGLFETGRALAARRPVMVDRDNYDDVLARMNVEIEMPVAGAIRFRDIDDFHPDRLYADLELFQRLKEAAEALPLSAKPPTRARAEEPKEPPVATFDSFLDAAVEKTVSGRDAEVRKPKDAFREWVDSKVEPHLEKPADRGRADAEALIAETAAAQMRAILHYPLFQRIEAAWRSLFFLVRRVETSPTLKIYLVDVSKPELLRDLSAAGDVRQSGIHKLLAESFTDEAWAVLAGLYSFGAAENDLPLLERLGMMAQTLGAPFLAAADSRLIGCRSVAATPDPDDWRDAIDPNWRALRRSPGAASVGLALPRFLLRLPYGRDNEPCDAFDFAEMGERPEHDRYLWGNPSVLAACLLAESFADSGWEFEPNQRLRADGLPLHIYREGGEDVSKPCAEVLLTERAADRILEQGIMPLVAYRDAGTAKLLRFQSIAEPPQPLAAWWNQ